MSSLKKDALVLFAIPSMGSWHRMFGLSVAGMISEFLGRGLPGYDRVGIIPFEVKGSILANKRVDAVRQLLASKCTHLLFIDTDQSFPKNTLQRLMAWNKDVVGANIATKKIPSWPTARGWPEDRSEAGWGNAPVIYTKEDSTGLEECARLGTGLVLIKRAVFEKIGLDVFGQPWKPLWQRYQGEDWSMCEAIEAAGFKMYIDHDLSKNVLHWGDFAYSHEYVMEVLPSEIPDGNQEEDDSEERGVRASMPEPEPSLVLRS